MLFLEVPEVQIGRVCDKTVAFEAKLLSESSLMFEVLREMAFQNTNNQSLETWMCKQEAYKT